MDISCLLDILERFTFHQRLTGKSYATPSRVQSVCLHIGSARIRRLIPADLYVLYIERVTCNNDFFELVYQSGELLSGSYLAVVETTGDICFHCLGRLDLHHSYNNYAFTVKAGSHFLSIETNDTALNGEPNIIHPIPCSFH